VLEEDEVQISKDFSLDVRPVRVINIQVKKLRGKKISTMKVLWDKWMQEVTRELEDNMMKSHSYMFPAKYNS